MRPGLAAGLGGPLNGQRIRQSAVKELFDRVPFDLVVETGTFRGTTTAFLRTLTPAPIVTIEANPRYALYARARLRALHQVRVITGDSATEIRRLANRKLGAATSRPFFYLDAHWGRRLPLRWEVLEIQSGWQEFCILVDDFQVPGDSGYRFDDYGPGFRLTPELFDGLDLSGVARFSPASPSTEESGRRRGWLVLARGEQIVPELRRVALLHEWL